MSNGKELCAEMEVLGLDFVRGEIDPADGDRVRAHLEACASCREFAADARRVLGAVAAREVPASADPAGDRVRLRAALDAAWAEEAGPGPVVVPDRPRFRLLERLGERYAESRTVRFLTFSAGLHAAAAVALAAWLGLSPSSPFRSGPDRTTIEVGEADPILDRDDPLRAPRTDAAGRLPASLPAAPWPAAPFPAPFEAEPAVLPPEDPTNEWVHRSLYPNEECRAWASPRFRSDLRRRRELACYGPVEGPRVPLAVDRGLAWLKGNQDRDGTWASAEPLRPAEERNAFRVGVTGVAVQAYHGQGSTAMRPGPFQETVRAAVKALAAHADPVTGFLGAGAAGRGAERLLVNHGPALAALAEAYLLDYGRLDGEDRAALAGIVQRGVRASLAAQLPDGSFGFGPGAAEGDLTVTLLQVEALESARRAGFAVDRAAMARAADFVKARIGGDGRVGHRAPGDRPRDATLTAEVLGLARALGLGDGVRDRMLAVVTAEAREGNLEGRVLFRTALLEAVVDSGDRELLAGLGPFAARATLDTQVPSGAFAASGDPRARATGDALATARAVRALTAPYRAAGL